MSRPEWIVNKNNSSKFELGRRQAITNHGAKLNASTEEKLNSLEPSISNDSDPKVAKIRLSRTAASASSDPSYTVLPPRQLRLSRTTTSNSIPSSTELPPRQCRSSTCTAAGCEDISPPRRADIRRSVSPESSPRRLAPPTAADGPAGWVAARRPSLSAAGACAQCAAASADGTDTLCAMHADQVRPTPPPPPPPPRWSR